MHVLPRALWLPAAAPLDTLCERRQLPRSLLRASCSPSPHIMGRRGAALVTREKVRGRRRASNSRLFRSFLCAAHTRGSPIRGHRYFYVCIAERAAGRGLTAHVTGIAAGAVVAAAVVATARACAL